MALCGPEDSVYSCHEKWNRALRQREAEAMRTLIDSYGQAARELRERLSALIEEIATQQGGKATPWQLLRTQRYRVMLAQVEEEMARLEALAAETTVQVQADALSMAGGATAEQLAAAGIVVNFDAFPLDAYAALVGVMADGTPLVEHLAKTLRPEAIRQLRKTLLSGLAAGWNPRQVARMAAQKAMGLSLSRAMTIARTEMLRAYRMGTLERYRESGVVEGWIWSAANDRRTCAACLALDCREFPLERPMETHPNCRCTMLPKVGVQYQKRCGGDWLAKQPPEVQDDILGKAAGQAYRAEAVQLDDFVGRKHSKRWGAMHYRRSLSEMLGDEAEVWKQVVVGRKARWLRQLAQGEERVMVAFAPQDVAKTWGRDEAAVLLSAERRAHYLKRHPEIVDYEGLLPRLIGNPDEVHRNKRDAGVAIFYTRVGPRYLRAVIAMRPYGGDDLDPFVISLRLARPDEVVKSAEAGRKVWP